MNSFDLIINDKEIVSLEDTVLSEENRNKVLQLIREHRFATELHQYGLPLDNKILLHGSSGCGKTMTAKALAQALGKKILILNLSNVVCSRIGETSQNIKMVFDRAIRDKAVLFLDEFDQIGKARGSEDKDVGEMRRLVNTLIQQIDYYPDTALLICATNHPEIIDSALIRRFQLKLPFEMPGNEALDTYYTLLLSRFPEQFRSIERRYACSFAEAKDYALGVVKANLITELEAQAVGEEELCTTT